jgi:hypothetical protein
VPLTLFTANQPIPAVMALIPAALGDGAEAGADHDGEDGGPEAHAQAPHAEEADEDRRELHVRRAPDPEELQRPAVPLAERDELRPAGLYGDDLVAVAALSYLNVC